MKIELWKLSDIKPYPCNPRLNDAAVDAVAASIREFGFRQPIVVDAGLDGRQLRRAAGPERERHAQQAKERGADRWDHHRNHCSLAGHAARAARVNLQQAAEVQDDLAGHDVLDRPHRGHDHRPVAGHRRYADFRHLRHGCIISAERSGLSPKMAQTLARHGDIGLTPGAYTDVDLQDQSAAIGALPKPPSLLAQTEITATPLHAR
jgi:ParB/Sulfiredoxin domain